MDDEAKDTRLLEAVKKQIFFDSDGCIHSFGPCGFYHTFADDGQEYCFLFDEYITGGNRCGQCMEIVGL